MTPSINYLLIPEANGLVDLDGAIDSMAFVGFGGGALPVTLLVLLLATALFALTSIRLRQLVERRTTELKSKNDILKKQAEELRLAEASLRERNEYLQRVVDSDLIGILFWDAEGNVSEANDFFLSMIGYTREDLDQHTFGWDTITPPELRARDLKALQEIRETGRMVPFEKEYIRKDGTHVPILICGSSLKEDRRRGVAFVLDLTERNRAQARLRYSEEQLRQSQKMEAMGRLAGGVAHDFNNLLTVINGYSTMLLNKASSIDRPTRQAIDEIHKAGTRAGNLTHQLLAFSRQQVLAAKILDLNTIVVEMSTLMGRLAGDDIELHFDLGDKLGHIKGDAGQLQQVIMNLVVNARDAMPKGGRVTLRTSQVTVHYNDETLLANIGGTKEEISPGTYAVLSVSDEGTGMTADVMRHLFEPFFTTKELGRGTGLGLSTAYGIVKQSGGYVTVESAVDSGSCFRVLLPIVEEAVTVETPARPADEMPRGTESILIVEDDEFVRLLVKEVLATQGYTVIVVGRPADALEIAKTHEGRIDLLLTDVVMPGMSGRDVATRISKLRPGIKVLFMSGYTDDAMLHHGVQSSEMAFIAKPFALQALASKVREVLDAGVSAIAV